MCHTWKLWLRARRRSFAPEKKGTHLQETECCIHWQEVLEVLEGRALLAYEERSKGSATSGSPLNGWSDLRGWGRGCRFQTWHAQIQHWVPDLCAVYPWCRMSTFPLWATFGNPTRRALSAIVRAGTYYCGLRQKQVNDWWSRVRVSGYEAIRSQCTAHRCSTLCFGDT